MSKEIFQELRREFADLAAKVGGRPFDLRWHNLSGVVGRFRFELDQQGGWTEVEWNGQPGETPPFDPAERLVVGQLCMPLHNTEAEFTSGLDPVSIPRRGVAEELLMEKHGAYFRAVDVGQRFRTLAAEAGSLLAPELRDRLAEYCAEINLAPANWWYALLFYMSGQAVVHQREIIVGMPLLSSVDAIRRFGLDTDEPRVPPPQEDQPPEEPAKRKAGRKPSRKIAMRNKKIAEAFGNGWSVNDVVAKFRISADLARKIKSEARLTGDPTYHEDES